MAVVLRKDSPTEAYEKRDTDSPRKPLYIAVMGITGAGKSHFIRSMTKNDDVEVSASQHSCTQQIGVWQLDLHGTPVVLLDTPGFDDSARSELDILKELADWFDLSLKQGIKLAGIVYLHPIILNRMYKSAQQNTRFFRKLVGDTNMSNVVLATSQWSNLTGTKEPKRTPEEVGKLREKELLGHEGFYKALLDNGARYVQNRDYESGIEILEYLVHKKPFFTDLAQELGENKPLSDTAAGKAINADLAEAEAKHKAEMQKLREEMKAANERDRAEIWANIQAKNDECRALEAERDRLANDQRNQTRKMTNRLEEMLKQQEAKLSAVQAKHEKTQEEFDSFKAQVEANRNQKSPFTQIVEALGDIVPIVPLVAKIFENQ